jgi:hypothetical protein
MGGLAGMAMANPQATAAVVSLLPTVIDQLAPTSLFFVTKPRIPASYGKAIRLVRFRRSLVK